MSTEGYDNGAMEHGARIRRSLMLSVVDGAFYAAMVGFGESFFVAYAVYLGANNIHIGLLGSIPQALASFAQVASGRLIHLFRTRKRLVLAGVFLQALMFIPICLSGYAGVAAIGLLITSVTLYWVFGMSAGPAWNSWMGDLTEHAERASYFGKRSTIAGLATFVTMLAGGYVLQRFTDSAAGQLLGFVCIFGLAFICRMLSLASLAGKYEPAYRSEEERTSSAVSIMRDEGLGNFRSFVLFLSLMSLSVNLSAPFFTPYMLKDLGFDYMTFTVINSAAIIAKLLSMPLWGRVADRHGSRSVFSAMGFLLPVIPVLWVFMDDVWQILLLQLFAGVVWGGYEVASFSFMLDITRPKERISCVAYYNLMNGLAVFAGAMLGGLIVRYNDIFWSKYLLVFAVSGAMRLAVSIVLVSRIREVRTVKHISYQEMFVRAITTVPTRGIVYALMLVRGKGGRQK